jgi:phage tail sheath protein FI
MEKKVIEIEIQDNSKTLKQQYKEAVLEVQKLADAFGATSVEVQNASKRAAELKDQIEDVNDAIQAPWYAPAGLNRGSLTSVTDTYIHLSQANRDTLYEARVNPIANFLNDGVCVWGQKTLQARPSALDRINVRRLLIAVKKYIASSTRYLVFEQNTSSTRNRFLSIVNPYMEQVRAQQGLYAFRVVMDQSNNTPDIIDQNI